MGRREEAEPVITFLPPVIRDLSWLDSLGFEDPRNKRPDARGLQDVGCARIGGLRPPAAWQAPPILRCLRGGPCRRGSFVHLRDVPLSRASAIPSGGDRDRLVRSDDRLHRRRRAWATARSLACGPRRLPLAQSAGFWIAAYDDLHRRPGLEWNRQRFSLARALHPRDRSHSSGLIDRDRHVPSPV